MAPSASSAKTRCATRLHSLMGVKIIAPRAQVFRGRRQGGQTNNNGDSNEDQQQDRFPRWPHKDDAKANSFCAPRRRLATGAQLDRVHEKSLPRAQDRHILATRHFFARVRSARLSRDPSKLTNRAASKGGAKAERGGPRERGTRSERAHISANTSPNTNTNANTFNEIKNNALHGNLLAQFSSRAAAALSSLR